MPLGWQCTLEECPAGHFIEPSGTLCFKTEYSTVGAFNAGGEYYHGKGELVQPVEMIIEDYEL